MMTVSLTFDDGVKGHLMVAAPLLEQHGWHGAFNICTDFTNVGAIPSLVEEKVRILGLVAHPEARLNWDDALELLHRGHEVYPHSCSHEKLGALSRMRKTDELRHEIVDSARACAKHFGAWPKFFCCPHLDWTVEVRELIRSNGMEMFNNGRPELGGGNTDVVTILTNLYWEGRRHVDLMFHGIFAEEGGHNPFKSQSEFAKVLDQIATLEKQRMIRVVDYSKAHFGPSRFARVLDFVEWARNKARRVWFRCVYAKMRRA